MFYFLSFTPGALPEPRDSVSSQQQTRNLSLVWQQVSQGLFSAMVCAIALLFQYSLTR